MNEDTFEFDSKKLIEIRKAPSRPDTLYRAFTVNPENLSLDMLQKPLVPGSQAVDDPTRIGDGNEKGVYMSTNQGMVEKVYACGSNDNFLKTPRFVRRGGQEVGVVLPTCGLVLEIDTVDLDIREPRMIPALIGHYNNGYEGYEWIADEVPPEHYKLLKLVLSTHPNDKDKVTIDVTDATAEELHEAINKVRSEYEIRRNEALEYKKFLESLTGAERMNDFILERKWKEYQKNLKRD